MTPTTLTRPRTKRTVKSFFPILAWLPQYRGAGLRADVIAALTVWALLVPEAMAYAGIAGMPPETGLYTAPLALLGYAIFGTSKHLNVGPSSTVAAISISVVIGFAAVGSDEFIALTIALAMLTGIVLALSGLLRLGVVADFLSKPVLDGFVVGVAISVLVGQLDKFLGFKPERIDFVPESLAFIANLGQTHWVTVTIGLVCLLAIFAMHHFTPKIPAALTVMVVAIAASYLFDFHARGVHIVGEIPAGLPPFGFPSDVSIGQWIALIPGAIAIALVAFSESVAVARSYATQFNYKVDADQELVATGIANMGAGFSGGFVVDGSLSKTAASVSAGANTQMVSIIAGAAVLITAAFLTPLFYYLPEATLAAIVIHAVWHLINYKKIWQYRTVTGLDFWTSVVAVVGVLLVGILQGILMALILGLFGFIAAAKSSKTSVLGKVPGEASFRSLEHFPEGETYPGLLVVRFDGSLFFANAPDFADEIREGVRLFEPKEVLVDCESITHVDATAVNTLAELIRELDRRDIKMSFARVRADVADVVRRTDLTEILEPDQFFVSVQSGVDAYLSHDQ